VTKHGGIDVTMWLCSGEVDGPVESNSGIDASFVQSKTSLLASTDDCSFLSAGESHTHRLR